MKGACVMEKSRKPILGVGTSSILLIFVLLCMITFAVLSLVSARSDYRLSQKNAEHIQDYYQAENKANEILLTIDQCLEEQYILYGNTEEYLQHVKSALEDTEAVTFTSEQELEFHVPRRDKTRIVCSSSSPQRTKGGGQLLSDKELENHKYRDMAAGRNPACVRKRHITQERKQQWMHLHF